MNRANSKLKRIILNFIRFVHIDKPIFYFYVYFFQRLFPDQEMKNERLYYSDKSSVINNIVACLSDERSKDVYRSLLRYRTFRNISLKNYLGPYDQYFPTDIFELKNDEVFVDCGAFDGDTIKVFFNHVESYSKIIAFEPDCKNFEKLNVLKNNTEVKKISTYKMGVGAKKGMLYFDTVTGMPSATLSITGNIAIEIDSLDNILKNEDKISFVKMDIEGAETQALNGAWKIIDEYRPILAICIYHTKEDMINIPAMLINHLLRKGYSYYIRHYTLDWTESVFYAVPKERCK